VNKWKISTLLLYRNKKLYHEICGYITYVKEASKIFYDSCHDDKCKRKVIPLNDNFGPYKCDYCNI